MKFWDCIILVCENEFYKEFDVKLFFWVMVGYGFVSDVMGLDCLLGEEIIELIFDELVIIDEDGIRL